MQLTYLIANGTLLVLNKRLFGPLSLLFSSKDVDDTNCGRLFVLLLLLPLLHLTVCKLLLPIMNAAATEPRLAGKLAEKLRTACILDCWNETEKTKLKVNEFMWKTCKLNNFKVKQSKKKKKKEKKTCVL